MSGGIGDKIIMYNKIDVVEAKRMMDEEDTIILDVREEDELSEGYIDGSINIPLDSLEDNIKKAISDKTAFILVYCRSGRRSKIAAEKLVSMGYENVYDFGGIIDWPFDIVM